MPAKVPNFTGERFCLIFWGSVLYFEVLIMFWGLALYFGVLSYILGSWAHIWLLELMFWGLEFVFRRLGLVISCQSCSLMLVL